MDGIAVAVALAAAGFFAVSTAVQHRSAEAVPTRPQGGGLFRVLLRDRWWLLGTLTGGVGFGLQALALHFGALTIVQPVLISGLVLALPIRAALDRRVPSRSTAAWAGVLSAGLALFLVVANPTTGHVAPDRAVAAILVGAGVVLAGAASWAAGRLGHPTVVGLLLGLGGGALLGLTAGVTKVVLVTIATRGPVTILTGWPLYALIILGGGGVALSQRAYQAAPLAVSMPVLNIFDPVAAMVFGAYVFGEKPADQPLAVVLEIVGLTLTVAGMAALARDEQPTPPTVVR